MRKYKIDSELHRRIDRLRSEVEQARGYIQNKPRADQGKAADALIQMDKWLDEAIKDSTPQDDRVSLVLKTEAELCLYEHAEILAADRIRLEDRLYRLNDSAQKAWKECLTVVSDVKKDEQGYRQLLRRLTYELAEAAESYQRKAKDRTDALFWIMKFALGTTILLLCFFVRELLLTLEVLRNQPDPSAFFILTLPGSLVITLLLSGSLGSMITVVRSMIVQEKVRPDNAKTLLVNVFIRVVFGAVYAIVVVFALLAGLLPIKPSSDENGLFLFYVVVAIVAGVSDQLFGQVISGVITGKKEEKTTKEAK